MKYKIFYAYQCKTQCVQINCDFDHGELLSEHFFSSKKSPPYFHFILFSIPNQLKKYTFTT